MGNRSKGHGGDGLDRRRFLGLLAAGAGTVALGACSDDDGGDDTSQATTTAPDGSSTTEPVSVPDVGIPDAPEGLDTDPFLLGVASGDPDEGSVVLWTRLVTDLADLSGTGGIAATAATVRWQVAADEAFERLVGAGLVETSAETGHSVHVTAEGLAPDTWYWYRFEVGEFASEVARTRTMPADGDSPESFVIAAASCQMRQSGHWGAYDHLVADEPDLVLHLGDYIYEYPGGDGETGVVLDREPQTLADYRSVYASYKRDPRLRAAHATAPWIITWDDHEVENNYAAETPEKAEDEDGFADRRWAAYRAFWEHHPIRVEAPGAEGALALNREVRVGSLATFLVLDGRQHRSDQVCGDNIPTFASSCDELGDEDHTILGAEQEEWLAERLGASASTWTVLAQQTVMKALVLGDVVLNVDQWDGYPAARRRLFESIRDAGVDNVVVLTGDIHASGAADLRFPDAGADGDIVAHEFVVPGISSQGLGAGVAGAVDFDALGVPYANFSDNGYVRVTITPESWRTEWVLVDTVDEPTTDARVDATAEIAAGTLGIAMV